MSWFRKAFSISTFDSNSYYSVLDPVEFYAWKYSSIAPKGSHFTKYLPSSDIFTDGRIVVSVNIDNTKLQKDGSSYKLSEDSPVDVSLQIGCIPSARELLFKYQTLSDSFFSGLKSFKEYLINRIYITSANEETHLFRLAEYDDNSVSLHNFGSVKELTEKFADVKKVLSQAASKKTGRAFETEEYKRFEKAMMFVNNSHLYVDASKMDRLLKSSNAKSTETKKVSWKELFLELSPNAQLMDSQITKFNNTKWVKDTRKSV